MDEIVTLEIDQDLEEAQLLPQTFSKVKIKHFICFIHGNEAPPLCPFLRNSLFKIAFPSLSFPLPPALLPVLLFSLSFLRQGLM